MQNIKDCGACCFAGTVPGGFWQPRRFGSFSPLTMRLNVPAPMSGCQWHVQLRVRTQTLYFPPAATNVVFASATGFPMPCASRNGEPIWSVNCVSLTHPPKSAKASASIKIDSRI